MQRRILLSDFLMTAVILGGLSAVVVAATRGFAGDSSGNAVIAKATDELPATTPGGATSSPTSGATPRALDAYSIAAPLYKQSHYLDCEAASLDIALAAKGIHVTQDWILGQMGADTRGPVLDNTGHVVQWGDPYKTFVGLVDGLETERTGYGVYYPPIARAAQTAGAKATGGEGWKPQDLYEQIKAGNPAVVWVSLGLEAGTTSAWTSFEGAKILSLLPVEHAMTLVGVDFSNRTVTLDDPLIPMFRTVPMSTFERSFSLLNNMAVVVSV